MTEKKELYDIYGLWHVPWWQTSWFKTAAITVAALALVVVVTFLYVWWRQKQRSAVPADIYAINQLKELLSVPTMNADEGKRIYTALTAILKDYFAAAYAYDTHAKTDLEFITLLQEKSFPADAIANIEDIISGAHFVKFAQQHALYNQVQTHINQAIILVKNTAPKTSK